MVSRKILRIQPISSIFGQNMGPNGQKVVKNQKKSEEAEKKFRTIFFFTFLEKNTYFPAKYRKFSPFLGFQAFFLKKSKNLKNIRKKSEKIKKADNAKNFGRGENFFFLWAKNIFCQLIGQFQAICTIFAPFMANCQNPKFFTKKA